MVDSLGLKALPGRFAVLLTCEHASNRIPARYGNLGLSPRQLASHIAWDPGAREIARACGRALACGCHYGRWSRLLVDLNRSEDHPKLMARVSFGVNIPGNEGLTAAGREERLRLYYRPYREAVLADLGALARGACIHIGVHSFAPSVAGRPRPADIGLLYDPARQFERSVVERLAAALSEAGFHVRRNYPYRGVSDGLTTHCRRLFPDPSYAGVELEVNQSLAEPPAALRRVAADVARALSKALCQDREDTPLR